VPSELISEHSPIQFLCLNTLACGPKARTRKQRIRGYDFRRLTTARLDSHCGAGK